MGRDIVPGINNKILIPAYQSLERNGLLIGLIDIDMA
jgi:hypothetical protein